MIRWRLWLAAGAAFVLGLLGIRAKWMSDGAEAARDRIDEQKAAAREEAKEIANEVEALDRDTLKRRAASWVRGAKR